jgi:eukaryotic-like serine/threonine-protein kinase
MDATLQPLVDRLNQLSDEFRELRDGVQKAIRIADEDPEMALTRARKVLEYVVRDVFERRVKEPPGTRPLENLLDRLVKDGHFPIRLDAYAASVRKLGNVGTHNFSETITAADVYKSLTQLMPILEWFFEEERPDARGHLPPSQGQTPKTTPLRVVQSGPADFHFAVVPKGLRSFEKDDADFFLELLPGPRGKDGLPESIRFWKQRIEPSDELTFTVGVIYGPSGCGKSSLTKAGLLPRLADSVRPVYVEATAEETEARLLKGLRKHCPGLSGELDLTSTVSVLRQGEGLCPGQKILIVLDQFEQWLHARRPQQDPDLVRALRQCDGERVQAILLVRDDFWIALTRFMDCLQIEMLKGQNTAMVDLFDLRHAKKVLTSFGRSFGALPDELSQDQESFLDASVSGLAQNDRVISVRLSLFAEMIKGKPWTLATLKEVGGTEGVGVTYLEETFSVEGADAKHRLHQKAARAVLRELLPEQGTDIKGNMRSRQELLNASGYTDRPKEFEELIRILNDEVRLMTPTDPDGLDLDAASTKVEANQKYYQLTHDYLVPSLREWLTRKQIETRRGRAELRLADRAAMWNAKRQNRLLPPLWESLNIWLLTDKNKWTEPQRKMMGRAGRVLGTWTGIAAAVVIAVLFATWEINGRFQARSIVKRLAAADIAEVPDIVPELDGYRRWADPLLRQEDEQAPSGSSKRLHLDLALLPVDGTKVVELRDRLPLVSPREFLVVREALLPYKAGVVEALWSGTLDQKREVGQRFQAACALATYAPQDARWSQVSHLVADFLVSLETSALVAWRDALRPAKGQLIDSLAVIYRDTTRKEQARIYATETLADFAGDRPEKLFDLLADAEPFQFEPMFKALSEQRDAAVALANGELRKPLPEKRTDDQRELQAKRQANAGVALLRLRAPDKVWNLLKPVPELTSPALYGIDPRIRSYFLHKIGPLGSDPQMIVQQLDAERDGTIRAGLVLALGEFSEAQLSLAGLSSARREPLIEKLLADFENEPEAGLHGAVEWLLRKWGNGKRLEAVVEKLKCDEEQLKARRSSSKQWYVNMQRQTFVLVDARDGAYCMGSPAAEIGRESIESMHRKQIGRRFAISAHETTKEQFDQFQQKHPEIAKMDTSDFVKTNDSPQVKRTWYEAVAYCNWLSEEEGIEKTQWCYEPNNQGKYAAGMKSKDRFWELNGYRLPTEAEWEYACRAGTVTSRYYGTTDELLPQYARYIANSHEHTCPVGSVKPNDFGLFDMLGNVWEWCFDVYTTYPEQTAEISQDLPTTGQVADGDRRMMRGGGYFTRPPVIRSAIRYDLSPDHRESNVGFRVARTYP